MSAGIINHIPPVLPGHLADAEEAEHARNEIINNISAAQNSPDDFALTGEDLTTDDDLAPGGDGEREAAQANRRSKLKTVVALVGGAAVFIGLMFLILSYLFGFGFFAPAKKLILNRSAGNDAAANNPAISDDEKLKTALTLAANAASGTADNPPIVNLSGDGANSLTGNQTPDHNQPVLGANPDLSAKNNSLTPSGNLVILPDDEPTAKPDILRNPANNSSASPAAVQSSSNPKSPENGADSSLFKSLGAENVITQPTKERGNNTESSAVGRSIFFGRLPDKKRDSVTNESNRGSVIESSRNEIVIQPPTFGTLLPVRLLGAVFTLRSSGGLVRMELTREVRGRGFHFPAGTVLVGTLRGSEYNRAFITASGLIDPKSGGLVKFTGEMVGADGASGIKGERKNVKSFGSRFLAALREAGGQAVNVLASRRQSGGAVIIDTASLTGSEIGDEVSALLRGNQNDGQSSGFIKINAGTEGYVLVTDLPGTARSANEASRTTNAVSNNDLSINGERILPSIGLSAAELADLFATNDANRIRAALPQMTPQMRLLAEKAVSEIER